MKRWLCAALCGILLAGLAPTALALEPAAITAAVSGGAISGGAISGGAISGGGTSGGNAGNAAASTASGAEAPEAVTRGEFCVRLWTAVGSPTAAEAPFTDLQPASDPDTARAAAYFSALDVTNGCGGTRFCPGEGLTLEQAVTLSCRFAAACGQDTVTAADERAAVSPWAKAAMGWALATGLTTAAEAPADPLSETRAGELVDYLAKLALGGARQTSCGPVEDSSFDGLLADPGFALYAPDGGWNLHYSVADGRVAQLRFMLGETAYCYRAAWGTAEDLSGVYFQTAVNVPVGVAYCSGWFCAEAETGSRLWWYDDQADASFSLSCEEAVEAEALAACAAELYLYTMKSAELSLALPDAAGGGWRLVQCDRGVLAVSEPRRAPAAAGDDAQPPEPETWHWAVAGLKPGIETTLSLARVTRGAPAEAADTVTYTVKVDKDYGVTVTGE